MLFWGEYSLMPRTIKFISFRHRQCLHSGYLLLTKK